jgi:hypothetical protein
MIHSYRRKLTCSFWRDTFPLMAITSQHTFALTMFSSLVTQLLPIATCQVIWTLYGSLYRCRRRCRTEEPSFAISPMILLSSSYHCARLAHDVSKDAHLINTFRHYTVVRKKDYMHVFNCRMYHNDESIVRSASGNLLVTRKKVRTIVALVRRGA